MLPWTFLLLLSAASAGVGLASATDDAPQPGPLPPEDDDTPGDPSVDDPSDEDSDINRNTIFGRSCAIGFVSVAGRCVRAEAPRSSRPRPPLPPLADDDMTDYNVSDDDFIRMLGVDADLLPPADTGSVGPTAMVPVLPDGGPDSDARAHRAYIDSLTDEVFLRELLRGVDEDRGPLPDSVCSSYRLGVVLITLGSVLLAAALLTAAWTGLRWRRNKAAVAVTV